MKLNKQIESIVEKLCGETKFATMITGVGLGHLGALKDYLQENGKSFFEYDDLGMPILDFQQEKIEKELEQIKPEFIIINNSLSQEKIDFFKELYVKNNIKLIDITTDVKVKNITGKVFDNFEDFSKQAIENKKQLKNSLTSQVNNVFNKTITLGSKILEITSKTNHEKEDNQTRDKLKK